MNSPQASLYDRLLSRFRDGQSLASLPQAQQQVLSILDNIERVLGSRAGGLAHVPDYGLPDLAEVFEGLPGSADTLARTLVRTFTTYEPRLADIQVRALPAPLPGQLAFEVTARLRGGADLCLTTTLHSQGQVQVRQVTPSGN